MIFVKTGTVSFGVEGLVFSGWHVEGGTDREFKTAAIEMCAPNRFIRTVMLSAL